MAGYNRYGTGFDLSEGVQKVAQLVWNTDTLSWVRWDGATAGAGGGTLTLPIKSKRFDFASPTVLYIGEAEPTTDDATAAWRIKRINFDVDGNPTQELYAAGGAATNAWTARAILGYS